MIKAVVFDLFETLITEWISNKYLSSQCAKDLGIDKALFKAAWERHGHALNCGEITYHQVLRSICDEAGVSPDEGILSDCEQKRIAGKNQCFDSICGDVLGLLAVLKQRGMKLALCSNCSEEEVQRFSVSPLHPYFDVIFLSYECGLVKPDREIYLGCAGALSVAPEECLFVGDGGSRELYGAKEAGMHPLRAVWFLKEYMSNYSFMPFDEASTPRDVLAWLDACN